MDLSFGQVEKVFMERFAIGKDREAAFRSRLQHIQRRKMFGALNTGKGTKAAYQWRHVIQLMVALDLIDMGVSPDVAVSRVDRHTDQIISAVRSVVLGFKSTAKLVKAVDKGRCPFGNTRILLSSAAVLSFEQEEGSGEFLLAMSSSEFHKWLREDAALNPAIAFVDLGSRMMFVARLVSRLALPDAASTASDLQGWLEKWANEDTLS